MLSIGFLTRLRTPIPGLKTLQRIMITSLWLRDAWIKLRDWVCMTLLPKSSSKRYKWMIIPPLKDGNQSWWWVRAMLFLISSLIKRHQGPKHSILLPYTTQRVNRKNGNKTENSWQQTHLKLCSRMIHRSISSRIPVPPLDRSIFSSFNPKTLQKLATNSSYRRVRSGKWDTMPNTTSLFLELISEKPMWLV